MAWRATVHGRECVRGHADRVRLADRQVVEAGDGDVGGHADAPVEQFEDQAQRGVVLVADDAVGMLRQDVRAASLA